MSSFDIEEFKVKDWTCSNCGHQSPVETFDVFENMQGAIDYLNGENQMLANALADYINRNKELEKQLEEAEKVIGFYTDSTHSDYNTSKARQYFKNKESE